ncbi:MAG: hypothetical protein AB8E82_02665 [Aureispira sp.]
MGKGATIAEEDLRDLLQASHKAGYKIGVDSPETMEGVEGLTHDHLMEISAGVYMKFNHAYVVGGCSESEVELLDPHGDNEAENIKIHIPILAKNINLLYECIEEIQDELKASNCSTFSNKTKKSFDDILLSLEEYSENPSLLKLKSKWNRLINRNEIELTEGKWSNLKSRAGESFLDQITKIKNEIMNSDIGKGFLDKEDQVIKGRQKVSFQTMKTFFEAIRINKIKK